MDLMNIHLYQIPSSIGLSRPGIGWVWAELEAGATRLNALEN
jgi:hypothetical protein